MWDGRTYPRQLVLVYLNSNVTGHPILCFFSLLNLAALPGGGQGTPELRNTVRAVTEVIFGYFRAGAWEQVVSFVPRGSTAHLRGWSHGKWLEDGLSQRTGLPSSPFTGCAG